MREIKFRAWDMKDKCMFSSEDLLNESLELEHISNPQIHHIFMQYTGLKDKNGVEIYEGDICKHNNDIAQIIFWEGAFIFRKYCIHDYALTNFACCRTFEVLGNIYENKELLGS